MATLASKASSRNPEFVETPSSRTRNNLEWLRPHLRADRVGILLVGGIHVVDFRLRIAQSHLRRDLTPSHWSNVALLGSTDSKKLDNTRLYEISLMPADGFGFPVPENGVQQSTLKRYASGVAWPNIALLYLPVSVDAPKLMAALERFRQQRIVLDAMQLVVAWLTYVWGVGHARNPLLEGMGIPSAAMLEIVTGAEGFDLTPGLESRTSCPEAIWQSASWWHEFHRENTDGAITGAFRISHYFLPELD